MKAPRLDIQIAAAPWRKLRGLGTRLERAACATLARLPVSFQAAAARCPATLLLTSDSAVRTLNRIFRDKDKPTNVLSFPQFARADLRGWRKEGPTLSLGDIAMAWGVTAREASQEGKKLPDHATHLLVHGLLHLFGYDHVAPSAARRMERLERLIMADLGLPDPYAPPPAPSRRPGRGRARP